MGTMFLRGTWGGRRVIGARFVFFAEICGRGRILSPDEGVHCGHTCLYERSCYE